jgi:hypothetical protein
MLARLHDALARLPDVGYTRWRLTWDGAAWCERLNVVERAILARAVLDPTDRWAMTDATLRRLMLRPHPES